MMKKLIFISVIFIVVMCVFFAFAAVREGGLAVPVPDYPTVDTLVNERVCSYAVLPKTMTAYYRISDGGYKNAFAIKDGEALRISGVPIYDTDTFLDILPFIDVFSKDDVCAVLGAAGSDGFYDALVNAKRIDETAVLFGESVQVVLVTGRGIELRLTMYPDVGAVTASDAYITLGGLTVVSDELKDWMQENVNIQKDDAFSKIKRSLSYYSSWFKLNSAFSGKDRPSWYKGASVPFGGGLINVYVEKDDYRIRAKVYEIIPKMQVFFVSE